MVQRHRKKRRKRARILLWRAERKLNAEVRDRVSAASMFPKPGLLEFVQHGAPSCTDYRRGQIQAAMLFLKLKPCCRPPLALPGGAPKCIFVARPNANEDSRQPFLRLARGLPCQIADQHRVFLSFADHRWHRLDGCKKRGATAWSMASLARFAFWPTRPISQLRRHAFIVHQAYCLQKILGPTRQKVAAAIRYNPDSTGIPSTDFLCDSGGGCAWQLSREVIECGPLSDAAAIAPSCNGTLLPQNS